MSLRSYSPPRPVHVQRWKWWSPERAALALRQLRVSSTGEPGDGKRQRVEYTVNDLLESADRLLAQPTPPDNGSRERLAFEDRWNALRLRLQEKLRESLLASDEELLREALDNVEAILLGGAAAASSGAPPSNDSQSGSSTQPPAGSSGSTTQPPGGSGSRTETPPNLRPPTESQTQPPPPTDLEVALEQGQRVLDGAASTDEVRAALNALLEYTASRSPSPSSRRRRPRRPCCAPRR